MNPRPMVLAFATVVISCLGVAMAAEPTLGATIDCAVRDEQSGLDYASLTSAIQAAAAGDTLRVQGTCRGNFVISRDLTLRGVSTPESGAAILDGRYRNTVVRVDAGSVHLIGLVIRHSAGGPGISTTASSSLTVASSRVQGNHGEGISAQSNLTLSNTRVTGNEFRGIDFGGDRLRIFDSTISGNHDLYGAGILAGGSRFELVNSTVSWNTAGQTGGGIQLSDVAKSTIRGSRIAHNTAGLFGGGLLVGLETRLAIVDSRIARNVSPNAPSGLGGGGLLSIDGATVGLAGTTVVTLNTGGPAGGGIATDGITTVFAADGVTDLDPISGDVLPAWTGRVYANTPDDCHSFGTGGQILLQCG
jgi:nitrous oxidase accessory protein NosD